MGAACCKGENDPATGKKKGKMKGPKSDKHHCTHTTHTRADDLWIVNRIKEDVAPEFNKQLKELSE